MPKLSKMSIAQIFAFSRFRLLLRTQTLTIVNAIDSYCFVQNFILQCLHPNDRKTKENETTTIEEKLHTLIPQSTGA